MTKLQKTSKRQSYQQHDLPGAVSKLTPEEVHALNQTAAGMKKDARYTSAQNGDLHQSSAPKTPPWTAQDSAYAMSRNEAPRPHELYSFTPPQSPVIVQDIGHDLNWTDESAYNKHVVSGPTQCYYLPEARFTNTSSTSTVNSTVNNHKPVANSLPPSSWRNYGSRRDDSLHSTSTSRERSDTSASRSESMTRTSEEGRSRRRSWAKWSWPRSLSRSRTRDADATESKRRRSGSIIVDKDDQDQASSERKTRASWISRRDLPMFRGRRQSEAAPNQTSSKKEVTETVSMVPEQVPTAPQATAPAIVGLHINPSILQHHKDRSCRDSQERPVSPDVQLHLESRYVHVDPSRTEDTNISVFPDDPMHPSSATMYETRHVQDPFINQSGDLIAPPAEPVISRSGTPVNSQIVRFWSLRRKVPRVSSKRSVRMTQGCLPNVASYSARSNTPSLSEDDNQSTDVVNNFPTRPPAQTSHASHPAQTLQTSSHLSSQSAGHSNEQRSSSEFKRQMPLTDNVPGDWPPEEVEDLHPAERDSTDRSIPVTETEYQWHGSYPKSHTSDMPLKKRQAVTQYVISAFKRDRSSSKTDRPLDTISNGTTLSGSEGSTAISDSRGSISSDARLAQKFLLFESSNPMDRQALRAFHTHPTRQKQAKPIPAPFVDQRAIAERLAKLHATTDTKKQRRSSRSVSIADPETPPTVLKKRRPRSRVISHSKSPPRSAMKKTVSETPIQSGDATPGVVSITGAASHSSLKPKVAIATLPTSMESKRPPYRRTSPRKARPHPLRNSTLAEVPLESAECELEEEQQTRVSPRQGNVAASDLTALPTAFPSSRTTVNRIELSDQQPTTTESTVEGNPCLPTPKMGTQFSHSALGLNRYNVSSPSLSSPAASSSSLSFSTSNTKAKRAGMPANFITGPNTAARVERTKTDVSSSNASSSTPNLIISSSKATETAAPSTSSSSSPLTRTRAARAENQDGDQENHNPAGGRKDGGKMRAENRMQRLRHEMRKVRIAEEEKKKKQQQQQQ